MTQVNDYEVLGTTERKIRLTPKSVTAPLEIVLVGDTSFGENYQQRIEASGRENILKSKGYDYPLVKMKGFLNSADLVIANLETPLTDIQTSPFADKKSYVHWSDIHKAPTHLLQHNIRVVNLANNHTFDFGEAGYQQTLDTLEKQKIQYFGAGRNQQEAGEAFIIESSVGGLPFSCAIIGAFQESNRYRQDYKVYADKQQGGINALNIDGIVKNIRALKAYNPDIFIIVSPHWGYNYEWKSETQVKQAQALIDHGADLILGHGAHMMQEVERFNSKWSVFSIGNFMFNSPGRYAHFNAPPYSLLAKLIVTPDKDNLTLSCRLYPIVSDNKQTDYQTCFVDEFQFNEVCQLLTDKNTSHNTLLHGIARNKDAHGYYLELPLNQNQASIISHEKNRVGLICNIRSGIVPGKPAKKWMYRAVAMNEALQKQGIELFIYAYNQVDPNTGTVRGYVIDEDQFIERVAKVPAVNYDWFLGSKVNNHANHLTYTQFSEWALSHDIRIYPNRAYTALSKDKFISFKTLAEFNSNIAIATELLTGKIEQIQSFLRRSPSVFLKPQFGSSGIGIIVIKKIKDQYTFSYYETGPQATVTFDSLEDAFSEAKKIIGKDPYIMQRGVTTLRIDSSTFDIRMVVIGHQNAWQVIPEVRLGAKGSDLSNVAQGGCCIELDELLKKLPLNTSAAEFKDMITNTVVKLTSFLDAYSPNHLMEMAYDIIIDRNLNIFITEINCKPGSPMIFSSFKNMLNLTENERELYTKYIQPHGNMLSNSIKKRLDEHYDNAGNIWFDSVVAPPLSLGEEDKNKLLQEVYSALNQRRSLNSANIPQHLIDDNEKRILFLSVSNGFSKAQVAQASGNGIISTLQQALTKIPHLYKENFEPIWIKLDIVTQSKALDSVALRKPLNFDRSLFGLAFSREIDMAFLPEQLNAYTLMTSDTNLHFRNIGKYVSPNPHYYDRFQKLRELDHCTLYQFKTESVFYDGSMIVPLYRGHRQFQEITQDILVDSLDLATDYLIRSVAADGKFNYSYEPKIDNDKTSYNILRHAGTIYSMLESYEVSKADKILTAAQAAIRYLIRQLKEVTLNGEHTLVVVEEGYIKLGGNALAALALAKFIKITQDTHYFPILQKLGAWIVNTQSPQGEFTIHKQAVTGEINTTFISEYYPGEALFALARLYQLDPQERWLNCAVNGALFLINVRDKDLEDKQLSHDHWLLYALNEIHRLHQNDEIYAHALRIANVIMKSQRMQSKTLDWIGSYYNPPRSTPTATRMEGLGASYLLVRDQGNKALADTMLSSIKAGVLFQLQTQFFPESMLYLPNPQKALGGFHRSLTDFEIRIDYVQHNISSLIALYNILKFDKAT